MKNLEGKVASVTGDGRGIGELFLANPGTAA
jgi:hypothetical protein